MVCNLAASSSGDDELLRARVARVDGDLSWWRARWWARRRAWWWARRRAGHRLEIFKKENFFYK